MDRGLSPLKVMLGFLSVGVIVFLGFLVFLGVKPTIKNVQPLNGSRTEKGEVLISAEVRGEANLRKVQLIVDKRVVDPIIKAQNERFWRIEYRAALPKGQRDVELTAIDDRGREQIYRWSFIAAGFSSPPKFANPMPRDRARLAQNDVLISLAAFSEQLPLESFVLKLNGRPLAPIEVKLAANERTVANLRRTLDPGDYIVTAEATDKEGEKATFEWRFSVLAAGKGEATARFFPQTGIYVNAPFYDYWNRTGGLAIFGFPITPEFEQNGRTVQWFERTRMECTAPLEKCQQVQLGLVGLELHTAAPALTAPPGFDRRFFPENGHSIGGAFKTYWETRGGLAVFGLPITEEIVEDGRTVQWFERARFEYNPQGAGTPNEILLGQLGRILWERNNPR